MVRDVTPDIRTQRREGSRNLTATPNGRRGHDKPVLEARLTSDGGAMIDTYCIVAEPVNGANPTEVNGTALMRDSISPSADDADNNDPNCARFSLTRTSRPIKSIDE